MAHLWLPCTHALKEDGPGCVRIDLNAAVVAKMRMHPFMPPVEMLVFSCHFEASDGSVCQCAHTHVERYEIELAKALGVQQLSDNETMIFLQCSGCEQTSVNSVSRLVCNVYGRSNLTSYFTWTCRVCKCTNNEPMADYQVFAALQQHGAQIITLSGDNDAPSFGEYKNPEKAMEALNATDDVWALLEDSWREVLDQ